MLNLFNTYIFINFIYSGSEGDNFEAEVNKRYEFFPSCGDWKKKKINEIPPFADLGDADGNMEGKDNICYTQHL